MLMMVLLFGLVGYNRVDVLFLVCVGVGVGVRTRCYYMLFIEGDYRLELYSSRLSGRIKDSGLHVKIWIILCLCVCFCV